MFEAYHDFLLLENRCVFCSALFWGVCVFFGAPFIPHLCGFFSIAVGDGRTLFVHVFFFLCACACILLENSLAIGLVCVVQAYDTVLSPSHGFFCTSGCVYVCK